MQERKVAVLLYGFPPGVGATGTAALLNVPQSLSKLLDTLRAEGYDLGQGLNGTPVDGEAVIGALKAQEQQRAIAEGARGVERWWVVVLYHSRLVTPVLCPTQEPETAICNEDGVACHTLQEQMVSAVIMLGLSLERTPACFLGYA